jgi:hypothetical protein
MGPNAIANTAQVLFFGVALFVYARHRNAAQATVLVVLLGSLFLPDTVLIYTPGLPIIGKDRVVYLAALLGILFFHRHVFFSAGSSMLLKLILFGLFIVNVITMLSNEQTMLNEGEMHPGLSLTWILGQSLDDLFLIGLPFVVGHSMFKTEEDLKTLLYFVVGMGLAYTVLILFEVMMSIPFNVFQLGYYVYGYATLPQFRYGLTEPVVFMGSGHRVATYMVVATIAAAAFWRINPGLKWKGVRRARTINLIGLLMTFKLASSLFGVISAFVVARFKPRRIALFATFLAVFACSYPALQLVGWFPEETLVDLASMYDEARAYSFSGRFREEDFVLDGIGERFWFGWGHFGRIPGAASFGGDTGQAGLDAWWVIKMGMSGILGVELIYFICAIPILIAFRSIGANRTESFVILVAALMLCIAIRMTDLLLNGWWNSFPVFLAGALLSIVRTSDASAREKTQRHQT